MVGAVASDDLVTSREKARDLDRIFVGFGAAISEEECIDVAGGDLGQFGTEPGAWFGSHERVRVGQGLRLFVNRANDALVAVADVDAHQLAVEVDETLSFRRPEIYALGAGHGDWVNLRLGRPLKECVLFGEINNLLAG